MRQIQINDTLGAEIISVSDVKNFARIDTNADDVLIGIMIESARIYAEGYLSRDIVPKDRTYYLDYTETGVIDIPFGPVDEVVSVTAKGVNKAFVEYGLGDKMIDITGPYTDILVNYITTGMNDGLLKQALLMMVSTYYDNRADFVIGSNVSNLVPSASTKILDIYKAPFI
jgi:hypothetical protein